MANCSCSGNSGSTYATASRGYGCLSSIPNSSGIPYNCFLPPTNTAYYQNFPFYNGPCGTVAGESDSDNGSSCGCGCGNNCSCNSWWNTCCSNGCNSCSNPEQCQNGCNQCGNGGNTMFCNCPCNICCGPAAALVTSNGAVTTTVGGAVPLILTAQASDSSIPLALASVMGPISVMSDSVVFNCEGTYLVTLTVHLPDTVTYDGTISLTANGSPITSATQVIDVTTEAYNGSSQALIRAAQGSTLTVNTSAALTATPEAGSIITLSIVRVA